MPTNYGSLTNEEYYKLLVENKMTDKEILASQFNKIAHFSIKFKSLKLDDTKFGMKAGQLFFDKARQVNRLLDFCDQIQIFLRREALDPRIHKKIDSPFRSPSRNYAIMKIKIELQAIRTIRALIHIANENISTSTIEGHYFNSQNAASAQAKEKYWYDYLAPIAEENLMNKTEHSSPQRNASNASANTLTPIAENSPKKSIASSQNNFHKLLTPNNDANDEMSDDDMHGDDLVIDENDDLVTSNTDETKQENLSDVENHVINNGEVSADNLQGQSINHEERFVVDNSPASITAESLMDKMEDSLTQKNSPNSSVNSLSPSFENNRKKSISPSHDDLEIDKNDDLVNSNTEETKQDELSDVENHAINNSNGEASADNLQTEPANHEEKVVAGNLHIQPVKHKEKIAIILRYDGDKLVATDEFVSLHDNGTYTILKNSQELKNKFQAPKNEGLSASVLGKELPPQLPPPPPPPAPLAVKMAFTKIKLIKPDEKIIRTNNKIEVLKDGKKVETHPTTALLECIDNSRQNKPNQIMITYYDDKLACCINLDVSVSFSSQEDHAIFTDSLNELDTSSKYFTAINKLCNDNAQKLSNKQKSLPIKNVALVKHGQSVIRTDKNLKVVISKSERREIDRQNAALENTGGRFIIYYYSQAQEKFTRLDITERLTNQQQQAIADIIVKESTLDITSPHLEMIAKLLPIAPKVIIESKKAEKKEKAPAPSESISLDKMLTQRGNLRKVSAQPPRSPSTSNSINNEIKNSPLTVKLRSAGSRFNNSNTSPKVSPRKIEARQNQLRQNVTPSNKEPGQKSPTPEFIRKRNAMLSIASPQKVEFLEKVVAKKEQSNNKARPFSPSCESNQPVSILTNKENTTSATNSKATHFQPAKNVGNNNVQACQINAGTSSNRSTY